MEYLEFVNLVEKMRSAQQDFFKTRDRGALGRAKALEAQVDKVIKSERP